ncbi:hypothetical protein ACOSQ3_023351 [Xanthoceras sorbifolium]
MLFFHREQLIAICGPPPNTTPTTFQRITSKEARARRERACNSVKVDLPWAALPPSWWPILFDLPRLPAPFFFSLQYEETRAVQGSRTFLPVVPSHRSSLWVAIVSFLGSVFVLLAAIGSFLAVPTPIHCLCERRCWCDRIGGVCSFLLVEVAFLIFQ